MRNKKKINLNKLNVKSFTTTFSEEEANTIKGGTSPLVCEPQTGRSFCSGCCNG